MRSLRKRACPLERRAPFRPTLIAELANDYLGYICTQEALERQGGYETWASPHSIAAAGTAENLATVAGRQLASLWPEANVTGPQQKHGQTPKPWKALHAGYLAR